MKKVLAITMAAVLAMGTSASAYIDLGNGQVQLEYGESYGSVAAAYGVNYYNLGYYNNCDVDSCVVQPGDVINIGTASAQSYYYGANDGSATNSTYYSTPDYTAYYDNGTVYADSYNDTYYYDNSTVYVDSYTEPSYAYAEPSYDWAGGSASIAAGYGGNAGVNVARACELNNNIVIPAGGTYYASAYLGDGSYDMGFVDATCLNSDGTTYQAPGGGICPVTTTIHMAGKAAGLNVIQANPHNGGSDTGVSYAAAEDQAMFNAGTSDLIMSNPYDHDIVLTCSYVNGVITASFN